MNYPWRATGSSRSKPRGASCAPAWKRIGLITYTKRDDETCPKLLKTNFKTWNIAVHLTNDNDIMIWKVGPHLLSNELWSDSSSVRSLIHLFHMYIRYNLNILQVGWLLSVSNAASSLYVSAFCRERNVHQGLGGVQAGKDGDLRERFDGRNALVSRITARGYLVSTRSIENI